MLLLLSMRLSRLSELHTHAMLRVAATPRRGPTFFNFCVDAFSPDTDSFIFYLKPVIFIIFLFLYIREKKDKNRSGILSIFATRF